MSVGDKLITAGTVPAVFAVVIFTVANADYALAFISVALVAVCAGLITVGILMRKNRS